MCESRPCGSSSEARQRGEGVQRFHHVESCQTCWEQTTHQHISVSAASNYSRGHETPYAPVESAYKGLSDTVFGSMMVALRSAGLTAVQ